MTGRRPLVLRCGACGRQLGTVVGGPVGIRTRRLRTPLPDGEAIACRQCRRDCQVSDRDVRAAMLAGRRELLVRPDHPPAVDLDGIDLDPDPTPDDLPDPEPDDPEPPWWELLPDDL